VCRSVQVLTTCPSASTVSVRHWTVQRSEKWLSSAPMSRGSTMPRIRSSPHESGAMIEPGPGMMSIYSSSSAASAAARDRRLSAC